MSVYVSATAANDAFVVKRRLRYLSVSPAVLLLLSLVAFTPLIDGGTTHLPVLIIRLLLLGAVSFWLVNQMKVGTATFPRTPMLPIVFAFIGWAALSMTWAPYKNPSVQWLLSLLMYALIFGAVLHGVRTGEQIWQVTVVIVGMGLFEGMLGIVQSTFLGQVRAKGTFYNPNFFATYVAATFSIVLGMLSGVRWKDRRGIELALLLSAAAILFYAFVMAQSRGALLALVAALAFIGCLRVGKIAIFFIILSLVVGALVPNPLKQRIADVAAHDPYAYSRVDIWKSSLARVAEQPFGAGAGLYKYTSFQHRFPIESDIVRYGKRAESAHNEYVQLAVELGVPGLMLFLLGIGIWVMGVKGSWRNRADGREQGLILGLSGAVMAILAHATVDSVFHEPTLVILLILSGGLVMAAQSSPSADNPCWIVRCPFHPVRLALAGVVVAILAVLSIQFAAGWYAHHRGRHEAQAGRQDTALDWFRLATHVDPGTTAYHDDVAQTSVGMFHRSGDPQWLVEAAREEELARELNPLDGRFPYRLGTIYEALAKQASADPDLKRLRGEAASAYKLATEVDPYSPFNYAALARMRLSDGQLEEGQRWLEQAIEAEPHYLPAHVLLAELALQTGKSEAARREADTIDDIKRKFHGRVLNDIERQFLDVDAAALRKAMMEQAK